MITFPPCKINIGLYVTRRRDDGYHDIESVFYPVPLCDALEVTLALCTEMHLTGLRVAGSEEDNLVLRAYHLLKQDYPAKVKALNIYLHKAIPTGAGLGGGSADGAYMLRLLNDHYELGLDKAALAAYALRLGSDCPFFIYDRPKLAAGRGEQLTDIAIDLSAYSLQLVCPQVHVATGSAFQLIVPRPAPYALAQLPELPVAEWKDHIGNDFEAPVFALHPELAAIKEQLYAQGAVYASMSGSGSAIYGLFPKGGRADVQAAAPLTIHYIE